MSTTYNIAHIREQGVDLIIVPVNNIFRHRTRDEQLGFINYLQSCSIDAGLAGEVIPVWEDNNGRMSFIANPNYHPFFKSISMRLVLNNINKKLVCN